MFQRASITMTITPLTKNTTIRTVTSTHNMTITPLTKNTTIRTATYDNNTTDKKYHNPNSCKHI